MNDTPYGIPLPTPGDRRCLLTIQLSAGELGCLCAIAGRVGVFPESLAWSYVVGELQDRMRPGRGSPPWRDLATGPAPWLEVPRATGTGGGAA